MTDEIARVGEKGGLLARPDGAEVGLGWTLMSADGFEVRASTRLVVRVARGEERVVRQTLMPGKQVLCAGDLAAVWQERIKSAVAIATGTTHVGELLKGTAGARAEIARVVAGLAYVSGLEIVGDVQLIMESPAWAAFCEGERRRTEREKVEAARAESARRMGGVLSDLRLRGVSGGATLAKAGNEEGQAILLAALGQEGGARISCVSGTNIVELTRAGSVKAVDLGGSLGPLRSVLAEEDTVFAGARDGVWEMAGNDRTAYRDGPMTVEHGFSVVGRVGGFIVGSHRQRGVVWWRRGEGAAPAGVVRPAAPWGPWSALLARGGDKLLIAGMGLEEITVAGEGAGTRRSLGALGARCVLLADVDGHVAAVCEDGVVRLYEPGDLRSSGDVRVGEPIVSAAVMPWVGGTRLLCATPGAIVSVGVEDGVVVRYVSAHRGAKEVAGGKGVVAAVSPDRMRAVLWDAWSPGSPAAEIHVGAITRGRISDVTLC